MVFISFKSLLTFQKMISLSSLLIINRLLKLKGETKKNIHFFIEKALPLKKRILFLPPVSNAKVAQLVEHDLAKVGVAGSNPVFRSTIIPVRRIRCRDFLLEVL